MIRFAFIHCSVFEKDMNLLKIIVVNIIAIHFL
jgi:hypothetical protein